VNTFVDDELKIASGLESLLLSPARSDIVIATVSFVMLNGTGIERDFSSRPTAPSDAFTDVIDKVDTLFELSFEINNYAGVQL
jgi:hypothetical protein